ncbi:hypothetical protein HPC49_08040 [Pyxidicoccus fallax]|uniref:Tetratricopeptide repeat protein n=1 Tax=Pyxidicoccus fallax TaxID=394095 RepID=A0A848LJ96_9BACT|nr:hypothetical protein [Pyxidicoccus fallax]NMO17774.1 hypothetical protein [Pyxidicoccus fallax]NPC78203.1 hypothetical protein [Pyxidicoccus fallax]
MLSWLPASTAALRMLRLLLLVLLPLAAPAAAPAEEMRTYVTSIRRLYESLEYERALAQVSSARRVARGMEDDVILSLYEGILLANMQKPEESAAAFKSALLLKPDAKLPLMVSPKVARNFESVRSEVKRELAAVQAERETAARSEVAVPRPAPVDAPAPSGVSTKRDLRSRALIPAVAGGVLLVSGAVTYGLARAERSRLREGPGEFGSFDEAKRSASRGRTLQTVGFGLAGAGVVGLGVAAGLFVLGAPGDAVSLGVSTDGTSAFVSGRWP